MANPKVCERIIPIGHPNRPGTKLDRLMALVVHYTGNDAAGATDTMNAKYIGRTYAKDFYWDVREEKIIGGVIEAGSAGKGFKKLIAIDQAKIRQHYPDMETKLGTKFRAASAHCFADRDSVTHVVPYDEVVWGVGDRPQPWDPIYKGQTRLAHNIFKNRQNYLTLSFEICSNDVILNSREDWEAARANTRWEMARVIREIKLEPIFDVSNWLTKNVSLGPKQILILRHGDLTGKLCPLEDIKYPSRWRAFLHDLEHAI